MLLRKATIKNYKSYLNPAPLELGSGFNIITGQNNAGKTALLEALSLGPSHFKSRPHRSITTLPTADTRINDASIIDIEFEVTIDELKQMVSIPRSQFYIPMPQNGTEINGVVVNYTNNTVSIQEIFDYVFSQKSLVFKGKLVAKSDGYLSWANEPYPSFTLYHGQDNENGTKMFIKCVVDEEKQITAPGKYSGSPGDDFGFNLIVPLFAKSIYYFRAERLHIGTSPFGKNPVLVANAENLPEVLGILQADKYRFQEYEKKIIEILPQIKSVSIRPFPQTDNTLEVVVWPHDPASKRMDLAVPLLESGTGISQVLAILYVVINSDNPRTIIIDEPQSFLHPGAARKMIEILKQYPQHQFIIATHSPTIITASNAKTISMIIQNEGKSEFVKIEPDKAESLNLMLAEVGASLSDVFGADNIIWVEGATEEIIFPKIIEKLTDFQLMGTIIKGVRNTGDFTGKNAELILDIYQRLSNYSSLIPPTIAFIFDDELRKTKEKTELITRSGNMTKFLKRRMFENYLLNPDAISSVINSIDELRESKITPEHVTDWIQKNKDLPKYGSPSTDMTEWIEYIDAVSILEDLFNELSQTRVPYRKPSHSVAIAEWLIQNTPGELSEVKELLKAVLESHTNIPNS